MSIFWSPIVHRLKPYLAGEQPTRSGVVKLNSNENPYGPSPLALAAIREATRGSLRLYPDPTASELRSSIAADFGIDPYQVFVGNGSDEVLAHTFQALLAHERPLLFPDITYNFYPTYCRLYDIDFHQIPLDDLMEVQVADYRIPCGAIILPNPNAPTGIALRRDQIETLVADHPNNVVVVDEAYVDFGAESAVPLVSSYANLLVVQTFSKSRGLAGLRVGFAVGQRPLIEALERVRDSFNSYPVGRLAIAGAIASWQDRAFFEEHTRRICSSRDKLAASLQELDFDILPSSANFVFASHRSVPGSRLVDELKRQGVLVRHFRSARTENRLRISVGTDADCDRLLDALSLLVPN